MGCIDSTAHTVELYSLLNEITKESFRNAIAEDDLLAIVELEVQQNYPTAIQISETGLLWTTIHFCCRFQSPKCLDYFLRKCYLLQPRQYLQFVNHQTAEGSTCLHLCAIWNAKRCFALLVKYGGLNLRLKNKTLKTIIGTARDYQRNIMVRVLRILHRTHRQVTPWNFKNFEGPINYEHLADHSTYDQILAQLIKNSEKQQNEKKKPRQMNKQKRELLQLKQKIQKEKEEMHQKRLAIIRENILKQESQIKEIEKVQAAQEGPVDLEQIKTQIVSKEEEELEKEFKEKQEELANIKKGIELLQQQAAYKRLKEEQQKVLAGRCSQEELMEHFINYKTHLLRQSLKQKQQINKNDQQQEIHVKNKQNHMNTLKEDILSVKQAFNQSRRSCNTSCYSPADLTYFKQLPKHIQKLYLQAQKQGSFNDKDFPHTSKSLGGPEHQVKIKPFIDSMVWLRPNAFLGRQFKLFDGIHPNDAKQGLLGVCYCLATVSNLACYPEEIMEIFPFYDLSIGFYVLRFYTSGKPNFVVVDDYFPCNASSQQPLFSKPIGKQIWVLLIQKAWAKLIGSYYAAELMTPDQFMQDLTGYPTYGALFNTKKDHIKDLIEWSQKSYPIVLTTKDKKMEGMVSSHAYSLLKIYQHESGRIYKLRNPWGRFEWNGCYGQKSRQWTPQLKLKCQFVEGDDGIFFLSEAEILEAFEYYSIGFNEKDFHYSFIQFSSKKQENIYFKFQHKAGKASFRVSQPFKRMVADNQYKYSGLLFEVGKIVGDTVKFISEGSDRCFRGDKSVYACNEILKDYEPGEYFVRLKMEWNYQVKYNSAVFSIFSLEQVNISQISAQQGDKLWKKLLFSFAQSRPLCILNEDISFSMHWMRGQMICYSQIRSDSKAEKLKISWIFKEDQLKNCELGIGKVKDDCIEYIVEKDKPDLGIVKRLQVSKSCSCGKVSLKSGVC